MGRRKLPGYSYAPMPGEPGYVRYETKRAGVKLTLR
jgi:hypothetical protein